MRYYVEINGESSLDIQGLMIQSLPSISKPLMRSKQETIDGRDGDIVTKLGYSAYDKTLKIGLWGNYDINEVIAFFNQEGEIVFSNEPDKYYRFTILNRDDYVSQLDKFRTCTIALHCQPYKYKLNEEAKELENEYVEQEGTSLTFNNTLVAPMNIDLKGNTLQNGTPTPSSPIPVNNVSGDNTIVVCGKNLFNVGTSSSTQLNIQMTFNGSEMSFNGTANANNYIIKDISLGIFSAGTYVYSIAKKDGSTDSNNDALVIYNGSTNYVNRGTSAVPYNTTITLSEPTELFIKIWNNSGMKYNNYSIQIQIEKNNQQTTYEAYNGTTYNIDLPVENLFDKDNANEFTGYIDGSQQKILTPSPANPKIAFIECQPNTTYTVSKSIGYSLNIATSVDIPAINTSVNQVNVNVSNTKTITTNATAKYLVLWFYFNVDVSTYTYQEIMETIQVECSKANTYTPYGTTPIELNKIGTYQDYIYKENDKWYLHKETGKVVLNGTESWEQNGENDTYGQFIYNVEGKAIGTLNLLCNRFINEAGATGNYIYGRTNNNRTSITIAKSICAYNLNTFKTWLANNNTYFYYLLTTPTNTEITYTPLIEQLESIKNAMSKAGTTNVNQVNNDAPFIITASVLSGTDSITLTNEGNTTSKPTLTITGSGVVGVYLENIQMFNISLGTNETIIIDTENMEAYYGSQLKNRQVTGDYSNFALQSGTNNLKFTGLVTNVEITNYNRWI